MFIGVGQCDIVDGDYFIYFYFIFNEGNFWEISIVEVGENFVNVYFSDMMWCFYQIVIV